MLIDVELEMNLNVSQNPTRIQFFADAVTRQFIRRQELGAMFVPSRSVSRPLAAPIKQA